MVKEEEDQWTLEEEARKTKSYAESEQHGQLSQFAFFYQWANVVRDTRDYMWSLFVLHTPTLILWSN